MKLQTIIFSLIVVFGLVFTSAVSAEEVTGGETTPTEPTTEETPAENTDTLNDGSEETKTDEPTEHEDTLNVPSEPQTHEDTLNVPQEPNALTAPVMHTDTLDEESDDSQQDGPTVHDDTLDESDGSGGGNSGPRMHTDTLDEKDTNESPVLTLVDGDIEITKGDIFTDPGATATDLEDGDLTSSIVVTGSVDADAEGTYTLTYTVTDSDGNTATKTRKVQVVEVNPGISGGGYLGGGSSGGRVLGATTELPAGCGIYLNDYLRFGKNNDRIEVLKLQVFLNQFIDAGLETTGTFDLATFNAVKDLQSQYANEILQPWVEAGFVSQLPPTGFVYQTTRHFINLQKCMELNIEFPTLVPASSAPVFGSAAPATGGAVLGAQTFSGGTCGIYLRDYLKKDDSNDSAEVRKLQEFLNEFNDAKISVNGVFDDATESAVRDLQAKYADEILQPWIEAGITVTLDTTGYVFKTTQHFINSQKCPELNLAFPDLR